MKWVGLIAFGGVGLAIVLWALVWTPPTMVGNGKWLLAGFGAVFLLAGIGSYFFSASVDKTFDTPFFAAAHMRQTLGTPLRRLGRFRKDEAVITDVQVRAAESAAECQVGFTCSLTASGANGLSQRTFVSRPLSYTYNGYPLGESEAQALKGRKVWVVYDPDRPQDYEIDIVELMSARQLA